MSDGVNEYFPNKPGIVNGIGCVVRFFTGTNYKIFETLVDDIVNINFSACIFVMDRKSK